LEKRECANDAPAIGRNFADLCTRAVRDFFSLLIRERLREETRRANEWNEEEERKSEKSGKREK